MEKTEEEINSATSWFPMTIRHTTLLCLGLLEVFVSIAKAAEPGGLVQTPYMELIRDSVVHRELALSPAQVKSIETITDTFDPQLFATRNKSEHERRKLVHALVKHVRPRVGTLLDSRQRNRLNQIELQWQGPRGLLRDELQSSIHLGRSQREAITAEAVSTDNSIRDEWKRVTKGRPRTAIQKQLQRIKSTEHRKILAKLTSSQRQIWGSLTGPPAPLSRLGRGLRYRAPEFPTGMQWLNSKPLTMASLRGKVVILHFYAFG